MEAAEPVVALVGSVLRNEPHMVALSDPDGVILRFASSRGEPLDSDALSRNLFEGASWNERDIGTNGIGTALAARAPVLVLGPQHFVRDYQPWSCVGVPLRAPDGQVVGALDLSVHNDRMSAHTWGWTLSLAETIEAEIGRMRSHGIIDATALESIQDPEQVRRTLGRLLDDRAELEEWDRRKDMALATLSHELNTPLQAVAMALELLARTRGNPTRFDDANERLRRQVKRLARVIGDVGDVARIKQGALIIKKELLDLNAVVTRAADVIWPQMDGRRHTLTVHLPPHPLVVDGDADRLEQVFTNILGNAAKYTPPGGTVVVDAKAADQQALVRVRDNGGGILPQDLGRIFGEFTRGVHATNDPGGMGIGLALVRSIVRLHGGTVTAHSDGPGKGSEFEVALPLAPGP